MLKKDHRIRKNKEFKRVFSDKWVYFSHYFSMKYAENGLLVSRFGFVVSLKVSKIAPKRNLLKRRMREIVRLLIPSVKMGYDIVFVMKKEALSLSYAELKTEALAALERKRLLKKS